MEPSYYYDEQLDKIQSSFDAVVMIKMIHSAGYDVTENPIDYSIDNRGSLLSIFEECLKRVFQSCEHKCLEHNEHWEEVNQYTLHLPELHDFYLLLDPEESCEYIENFTTRLKRECEYLGNSMMEGSIISDKLIVTVTGAYAYFSPFLSAIIDIKTEVIQVLSNRRNNIVDQQQNAFVA